MNTTVSIILPIHNQAEELTKTVTSVSLQTFQAWELIIIDDGSTDGTMEAIDRLPADERIRYVYQDHKGFADAYNYGVHLSRGSYLALLTAGQQYDSHAIASHLQQFRQFPDTGMSVSPLRWVDRHNKPAEQIVRCPPYRQNYTLADVEAWLFDPELAGGISVLRRDWFERMQPLVALDDTNRITWHLYTRLALTDCTIRTTVETIRAVPTYLGDDAIEHTAQEADVQADVLRRIRPQLMGKQRHHFAEALAWVYVRAAAVFYGHGLTERGHAMLREAVNADSGLLHWNGVTRLELLLRMIDDDAQMAAQIADEFNIGRKMRRAQARRHITASQAAEEKGNHIDTALHVRQAVALNPLWYLRWFVLSVLMRYRAAEPQA